MVNDFVQNRQQPRLEVLYEIAKILDVEVTELLVDQRKTKRMSKPIIDLMKDYIKSPSRNKIVFHSDVISDIVPVNLGLQLSEAIYNFEEPGKIPMKISKELDIILNTSISQHEVYGRYLSIENLGILFEPEIKLDFTRLLDSYSQNNVLFVRWAGEIDTENIYFLTKENGIKINIKNLSHIAI